MSPERRLRLGPIAELPDRRCVGVGEGRAVVVRTDDGVAAFQGHCLHQKSPLDGGLVMDGVLICPHHFWRYRLADGTLVGSDDAALERLDVEVVDGDAYLLLPPEPEPTSIRDELLARARDYDRATEFERRQDGRPG